MCSARCWISSGAVLAALAVAAGAFGAHGVDRYFVQKYGGLDDDKAQIETIAGQPVPKAKRYLEVFQTAARYQMYHALGLIAVGLLGATGAKKSLQLAGWAFALGTVLFSGSLYVLTLTGITAWGMVTPFGGLLFIVGWIALAVAAAGGECPRLPNQIAE